MFKMIAIAQIEYALNKAKDEKKKLEKHLKHLQEQYENPLKDRLYYRERILRDEGALAQINLHIGTLEAIILNLKEEISGDLPQYDRTIKKRIEDLLTTYEEKIAGLQSQITRFKGENGFARPEDSKVVFGYGQKLSIWRTVVDDLKKVPSV